MYLPGSVPVAQFTVNMQSENTTIIIIAVTVLNSMHAYTQYSTEIIYSLRDSTK